MSAVLAAQQAARDDISLVALKVMRQRWHRDREVLERATADSSRLASLKHRHIVAAQRVVWVEDRLALLEPHVHGLDLMDWFDLLGELKIKVPVRVVCEVVKGVASALDTALNRVPWGATEALGIVHRDLKPSNVMVDRDGEVKVLDFATGMTSLGGRDARAAALRHGLAKYLSPGRRDGRRAQPSSDIYALGIMALELLGGAWMRRLRSSNPAHDRHLAEVVANLDLDLPTSKDEMALRNIVLRMVAFDPDARPPATEVVHTFRRLADRASGNGLETFAQQHLVPFLEPVPDDPDHGIALLTVRAADRRDPVENTAPGPRSGVSTVVPEDHSREGWEETASGWRRMPPQAVLQGDDTLPRRATEAPAEAPTVTPEDKTPSAALPPRPRTPPDLRATPSAPPAAFAVMILVTIVAGIAVMAAAGGAALALILGG